MFDNLSDKLQSIFSGLRGKGRLTEEDIDTAMREIRMALLEADVNFKVVKEFTKRTKERCLTAEVLDSLTPAQNVVKIVLDELTALMGEESKPLQLSSRIPNVIMLVGLQGSGKTTAAAKLAYLLKQQNHSPLLCACDVYRPAAADQLQTLGEEIGVRVYRGEGKDPVKIAKEGVRDAIDSLRDVVIVDTAGRLHVDEEMMAEAEAIKAAVEPDQIYMVVDAMTGQDAVNVAKAFADRVDFDGVIMSKMDGDARGGGALSIKQVTGKPITFISQGEKPDSLERFHPDRMAKRILGMGDVVSIIESASKLRAEEIEQAEAERMARGNLTLNDFLLMKQQIGKMGGQIRSDSRKICPRFLNVLLGHGDGNILFLRDSVCSGRFVQEHIVILFAVFIQPVLLHGHQDGFLKIRPVQSVVIDCDLRGSSAVQAVQKLRVCQKHALFILTACHQIVDVRESEGLGELIPNLKNAIRPDVLDWNKVLHFSRNLKLFLVLCKDRFDTLNHCACRPPFLVHR